MKPLLKWVGSKRASSEVIEKVFAMATFQGSVSYRDYIEPFLGAGAVGLRVLSSRALTERLSEDITQVRTPSRFILSDASAPLMNLWRVLQTRIDVFLSDLDSLPVDADWRVAYPEIRAGVTDLAVGSARRAAYFVWLNRAAFNGLWRVNRAGKMNAPPGSYLVLRMPPASEFRAASTLLQRTGELRAWDWKQVLSRVEETRSWIYLDPPYAPKTKTASFTGYSPGGFCWADQAALAHHAETLQAAGHLVVASNQDLPEVRDLWHRAGFSMARFEVGRAVNCKGSKRGKVGELLIAPESALLAAGLTPLSRDEVLTSSIETPEPSAVPDLSDGGA